MSPTLTLLVIRYNVWWSSLIKVVLWLQEELESLVGY